jgi:hypothetical protein
LPRERDLVISDTSSTNKDLLMKMKMSKCILKFIKISSCDEVTSCDVTKVQKCRETFSHLRRYMACNCTKIDL